MKFTVNKRYLILPVSYDVSVKKVMFYRHDKMVYDMVARLDNINPDTYYYIDLGRFSGQELTLCIEPDMKIDIRLSDKPDMKGIYKEKYRPAAHFSAMRGWTNDPNGLVYADGIYHMFFQHNPAGRDWGNMHWGHAVSTDLMHWEEKEEVLFIDETGTMFSGSGIIDERNLTGLKETEHSPILLYYTAAGGASELSKGRHFTQCLAFSTDGGRTFKKYSGNPLIKESIDDNRDPKVVYCPERECYYLALYLKDSLYALFTSKDLLNWELRQELTLPEDAECPDLYPLYPDGGSEKYWVFSGASDRYYIGKFNDEGFFVPVQPAKRLHYGTNSYAAQTFSGIQDGRTVRIAWNTSKIPGTPFNCAMCTPTQMSLKTIRDEIMLCSEPVGEIEKLYANHREIKDKIIEKGGSFSCKLEGKAQDIRLKLVSKDNSPFRISLLGSEFTVIPGENCLKYKNVTMPLFIRNDCVRLRLITDTNAVEVYADRGEAFICVEHVADYNLDKMIISSDSDDIIVREIKIDTLRNIWETREKTNS